MFNSTNPALMIADSISADAINATCAVAENATDQHSADVTRQSRRGQLHRAAERGMVTAEYAVGILAAVALALVLLKVFNDNSIFTALLHYVTQLIGKLSTYIK